MADTTTKGFPYPEGPDAVDVAGDIQALAEAVDDMPGVQSYTGAEITALTAGEKWAGRIVWNSTTSKLQVSNGSTFSDVDTSVALASTNPAALGVAAPGNGTTAARDNHVHAMPSASDVGAVSNALLNDAGKGALASTTGSAVSALAVGSNGQVLMADSGATAGLRYVDPPTNRSLIINGGMQVAQRSTSVTGITSFGYYTADRWRTTVETLGTWTQSIEADAPSGSGFSKSLKILCTTADASPASADRLFISQILEGQDIQRVAKGTSSAQQLTLSFWVKANVTGTYIAELFDFDNTRQVSAAYTISSTATWEKKTITFPADTTGAFDNDNSASLFVTFYLAIGSNNSSGTLNTTWNSSTNANRAVGQTNVAASTNNYWQVTGVQLETGPVATPFEFEPFEATLAKCFRYYEKSYALSVSPGSVSFANAMGLKTAFTSSYHWFPQAYYKVTKRANPTLTIYSTATGASGKVRRATATAADQDAGTTYGGTNSFIIFINNVSNAADVEIEAQYTADAEL